MAALRLQKYEALGNDFLVVLPGDAARELTDAEVVALCDRHRGVGADGLIELGTDGTGLVMRLRNADGSAAETSGNGLRCAALAAFDAGVVAGDVAAIATAAGPRVAERTGAGDLVVTMGVARVVPEASPLPGRAAFFVDVGNPHLVLLGQRVDDVDLAVLGPGLEAARAGGQNVEVIALNGPGSIDLVVYERGAGITEACGSGSVAAAAAARSTGAVGDEVVVENPGGPLLVRLSGPSDAPDTALGGPARRVCAVGVEWHDLALRAPVGARSRP